MEKSLRNKLLVIFVAALLLFSTTLGITFAASRTANAEETQTEIDYVNQPYYNKSYAEEGYIYKIDCTDVIAEYNLETRKGNVVFIQFRESSGCSIFFIEGMARNYDDRDELSPSVSDMFSEYYDIVHYDAENNYVYITFKNLNSEGVTNVHIQTESTAYVEYPQGCAVSDLITTENIDSVFGSVFYFVGGARMNADDLGKIFFSLNYNIESVAWDISSISLCFDTDNGLLDGCSIAKPYLSTDDFEEQNESTLFTFVEVSTDSFLTSVTLKAVVEFTYGNSESIIEYEYKSSARSICQIWESMESAGVIEDSFGEDALFSVQHYLNANKNGFSTKANISTFLQLVPEYDEQMGFYDYKVISNLYVYRFPVEESLEFYLRVAASEYAGDILYTYNADTRILTSSNNYGVAKDCSVWVNKGYLFFSFFGVSDWTYSEVIIRTRTPIVSAAIAAALSTDYENELLAQIEEWKQKFNDESENLRQTTDELNAYKADIIALKADYDARIQTITKERDQLQTQLDATILAKQNEIDNLTAEKESLETQIAQKEMEIQTLQNSLNATTNNYNEAAAELEAKKIEYNQLKADYDQVCAAQSGDTQAMIKTINEYRVKIAEKDAKIEELEDKIAELEEENEKLSNNTSKISMGCAGLGNVGSSGGGSSSGGGGTALLSTAALLLCLLVILERNYARKRKTVK